MRPLLLPGLLDAAQHNAAHGRADVALFESAHVYLNRATGPDQLTGRRPAADSHLRGLVTAGRPGRVAHPGRDRRTSTP